VSDQPLRLGLVARWARVKQTAAPVGWDVFAAEYIALGILYALHHDERGEPEGVTLGLLAYTVLIAFELGVLASCMLDGVGPRLSRTRLVGQDGGAAPVSRRLARFALWQVWAAAFVLVAVLALYVARLVHEPLDVWIRELPDEARAAVRGLTGLLGVVLYYLSGLLHAQGRLPHETLSKTHFESVQSRVGEEAVLPWYRQSVWWIAVLAVAMTYLVGWRIAEIRLGEIVTGMKDVGPLASALMRPQFGILKDCAWAMVETVYLALMATTFAVPIAIVLSFFGARNIMPRTFLGTMVYTVMRAFFTVTRSIEPIVWAVIFVVWVGLGPFAGMMALLVHSVAALGKLYSEQVESISPGPVEAVRATGAGPVHTIVYAVWPQVVPPFVAFTLYRWDINVRMATVVGLVGGGGIGTMLLQYQGMLQWREVALIVWMITLVVWLMDITSARVRERIL